MSFILVPTLVSATTFNVTLTTSDGRFAGKAAAPFGNTAGPVDIDLTPDVPGSRPINQFTNFFPTDVFPHEAGATTTITQTLTVDGVSTTATRTLTLVEPGDCSLFQQPSPVTLTVDLGLKGKVTLTLPDPLTLAVPCFNG